MKIILVIVAIVILLIVVSAGMIHRIVTNSEIDHE